jgi:hypothetical protein
MHGRSTRGNNLHRGISDALCKRLNEIGVASCANALNCDAHEFAVID